MKPNRMNFCLGVLLILGGAVGCTTVGPDYVKPEYPVPDTWSTELAKDVQLSQMDGVRWWALFQDPVLTDLVERATAENLDLGGALARIDQARALLGVTRGAEKPRLDANGSYSRSRQSAESSLGGKTLGDFVPVSDSDSYQVGLGASWELDLFGRVRRSVEASEATWQAAVEDYGSVLVALRAEVALTYIEIRSLQRRVAIAESNVVSQVESRELARRRTAAGTAPGLDLAQAEANVASTQAQLPGLKMALFQAQNRMSALLGEHPGHLPDELTATRPIPSPPVSTSIAIPADLIRQRPDIRRAERQLAAQTARLGVATADLYPRLSLGGIFGYSGQDPSDLFQSSARTFSVGPNVAWNLFSGNALHSNVRAQEARVQESFLAYGQTVLRAFEEVENLLANYRLERERNASLRAAAEAYGRAVGFAEDLYKGGKSGFQNVLDAQRNLLAFEDQLAISDGALVEHMVALYRAMGGGWNPPTGDQKQSQAVQTKSMETHDEF